MNYLILVVSAILCLFSHITHCQIITTIASGTNIGDGGPASNAAFGGPTSIGFDRKGNTFVMDTDDERVRKVDANGIITTLVGGGEIVSDSDGGPAINASVNGGYGLAIDATGNVYFINTQNSRIRKVDVNGIITTIAGTSTAGFSGDGGRAIDAKLNYPQNIAIDKIGSLYIADTQNNRIRKISSDGIITTVAGSGTSGFSGDGGLAINARLKSPGAIAIDGNNDIYIADTGNYRIRKVDTNGTITTVAGNGSYQFSGDGGRAVDAPLYVPMDVAVDASGNIYISQQDGRVRKVTPSGVILPVIGSNTYEFSGDGGLAVNALAGSSLGVDLDTLGNIYISDRNNYRIRRITPDGIINTVIGGFTGDGGSATNAFFRKLLFKTPDDLAVDLEGNVYVSDRFANRIRKISPDKVITTVAGKGVNGYAGDGGLATDAQLRSPRGIGLDSIGNLYLVDQYNSRVRKLDRNKKITTIAGDGSYGFLGKLSLGSGDVYNSNGMAVFKDGTVYIPAESCILKITNTGIISVVAGSTVSTGYSGDDGLAINAKLRVPTSIALDATGNIYIADSYNNRVRKVDVNGIISTIAGNGSSGYGKENVLATDTPLFSPYGVAVDAAGIIYVSEPLYSRIRKIDLNGLITTVAGRVSSGFSGDGGLATNAYLSSPEGIATDAVGNLYIADKGDRSIRKVTYPIQPKVIGSIPVNCSTASVTLTAKPTGVGFTYQFGAGATQIGTTNQAIVSTGGVYSVTVATTIFGSPAGSATVTVPSNGPYTIKPGKWNDPTIWACGTVPNANQQVRILHQVDVPSDYQAEATTVQYELGGNIRLGIQAKLHLTSSQ